MKPPFKISWEEVTPATAAEWLKKNPANRNLRTTTVHAYARDMMRKAWSPNHQAIAFDTDKNLIDGQHRLAGVVTSGCSQWFLVIRDVPKRIEGVGADVMDTVDRGNARSVADTLKIQHGYVSESSNVVATCNMVAIIGIQDGLNRVKRTGVPTVLSIAERFRNGLQFIVTNRSKNLGLRSAPVCAAVVFAYDVAPNKIKDFYKRFSLGVELSDNSPILTLRNYLLGEGVPRSSSRVRLELAELVLHTIWSFIHKKEMARPPRPGQTPGADWFRNQQPQNLKFLESLFPAFENKPPQSIGGGIADGGKEKPVVSAKDFKLTPAAEALLSKPKKPVGDRLAYMRDRVRSGAIS